MRQLFLLFFCATFSFNAQAIRVFIDHQTFYNSETGPYLEIVFSFEGKSMQAKKNQDGQYISQANCSVIISKGNTVVDFAKFKAQSTPSLLPETSDFMSMERMALEDGI
jgi:hypothetical protein